MRETTVDKVDQTVDSNTQELHSTGNEQEKKSTKRLNLNDLLIRLNKKKKVDRKNNLLIIFLTISIIFFSVFVAFYFN